MNWCSIKETNSIFYQFNECFIVVNMLISIKGLSNHFFTLFLSRFFIPLPQESKLFRNLDF